MFPAIGFFHDFHSHFGLVSTFSTYTLFGCQLQIGFFFPAIMQAFHDLIVKLQIMCALTNCCFSETATAITNGRSKDKKQIMDICSEQWNIKGRIRNWVREDLTRSAVR